MSEGLLVATVAVPLVLVLLWTGKRFRGGVGRWGLLAPLPALLLVAVGEDCAIELPWLLFGSRFALDPIGRTFLGCTAAVWFAAGIYGRSYLAQDSQRERYELFWLLTLSGNLGVIVSHDIVSFLMFFSLMGLAAYGLIVHDGKPASLRAGRIYLGLAVLAELLLFWAAVIAAQETGQLQFDEITRQLAAAPHCHLVIGLLLLGAGIKLGIMPLHFWLPLAHPAAPTPASAVLSGAIIKVGLLGWMRCVPVGEMVMPQWGTLCVGLGAVTALIAALIGVTQQNAKALLAYSSISQMGLLTIGWGAALLVPEAWTTIRAALLLFVVHHAITKAALFLGVGIAPSSPGSIARQTLIAGGLVFAAASLAGLPGTSGLAAKQALKYATATTPESWARLLGGWISLTGVSTSLLMIRFLYLTWPQSRQPQSRQPQSGQQPRRLSWGMALSWGALTLAIPAILLAPQFTPVLPDRWFTWESRQVWSAVWPSAAAGLLVLLLFVSPALPQRLRWIRIPAGDVAGWGNWIVATARPVRLAARLRHQAAALPRWLGLLVARCTQRLSRALGRAEQGLGSDLAAGLFLGLLVVVMLTWVFVRQEFR